MNKLRVSIQSPDSDAAKDIDIEALDISTALMVADINLGHGDAEIWDGDNRLARLSKMAGAHAPYWRVG